MYISIYIYIYIYMYRTRAALESCGRPTHRRSRDCKTGSAFARGRGRGWRNANS